MDNQIIPEVDQAIQDVAKTMAKRYRFLDFEDFVNEGYIAYLENQELCDEKGLSYVKVVVQRAMDRAAGSELKHYEMRSNLGGRYI